MITNNSTLKTIRLERELEKCGVNHILHLLMSVLTVGVWLIVWAVLVDQEKRKIKQLEEEIDAEMFCSDNDNNDLQLSSSKIESSIPSYRVIAVIVLAALIGWAISMPADAHETIDTGDLSYDVNGSQIITGRDDVKYLGWSHAANLNYEQTLIATSPGGIYANFHIASQAEALKFFSDATGEGGNVNYLQDIDLNHSSGQFGNNFDSNNSFVFFISDSLDEQVGVIGSYGGMMDRETAWGSIEFSNEFATGGAYSDQTIGWLLVSDDLPSACFNQGE